MVFEITESEAIRNDRIELYAQPLIDPEAPSQMRSYEVLTRLRDKDGQLIRPPEFLTLASRPRCRCRWTAA